MPKFHPQLNPNEEQNQNKPSTPTNEFNNSFSSFKGLAFSKPETQISHRILSPQALQYARYNKKMGNRIRALGQKSKSVHEELNQFEGGS